MRIRINAWIFLFLFLSYLAVFAAGFLIGSYEIEESGFPTRVIEEMPQLQEYFPGKKVIKIDYQKEQNHQEYKSIIKEVKRKYGGRIELAANRHNYSADKIIAVIVVESSGNSRAVSKSNAIGLMQLKRLTARAMGVSDPFHPYENIWAGTKYLKRLEKRFGNFEKALAAYNLGPTELDKRLSSGFDPSSFKYVQKVKKVLTILEAV